MAQEILNEKHSGGRSENLDNSDEEDADDVVDLEGELVCPLEELDKVRKEFKKYKKFVIKEHDLLNKNIEESNSNITAITTQLEGTKRMFEVTKLDLENKEKEYQKIEEEFVNLKKKLEKCKDELKLRIKYEGSIDALDKMLNKKKYSKDIEGVGFDASQCSTNKDSTNKEIHFVSSSKNENKQTFTISKPTEKKTHVFVTKSSYVGPKRKSKMEDGSFTKVKFIIQCKHKILSLSKCGPHYKTL